MKTIKIESTIILLCVLIGVLMAGCGVKSPPGQSPTEVDLVPPGQVKKTEVENVRDAGEETTSVAPEEIFPAPTEEPTSTCTAQPEEITNPVEATPVVVSWGEKEAMIAKVKADLASRVAISVDEISLASVEAVTWNDSSLGCPSAGGMYLQVLTPGYKIILMAEGKEYSYHTDESNKYILCNNLSL